MDRDLVTRVVLCSVLVVVFLVSSQADFHVHIVAPVVVASVALVMFWPRRSEELELDEHMEMEMEEVK